MSSARLRAGDWVEVRSKAQVLATLDSRGRLDGLPFIPEMFKYCGQRMRVSKRAHKTSIRPAGSGGRGMKSAVHLEDVRCDGQAHGGRQASCLTFWKGASLKPVADAGAEDSRAATQRIGFARNRLGILGDLVK